MDLLFRRTGERRYAVAVQLPGYPTQALDQAPGFDPDIPHDLVHYLVEAELGLESGVCSFRWPEVEPREPAAS